MYGPQMTACYGGRELFNMCQVLHYAQDQLGSFVVVDGAADKDTNACCGCRCCEEIYTTPENDDVCWYSADAPHSGEFLGFLPTSIGGLSTGATIRAQRATRYGDVLTRRRVRGREIRIEGWLLGTTRKGIDHGYAYLAKTLKRDCGPAGGTYSFFLGCQDDDPDPDIVDDQWTVKRVGLLEGPTVTDEYDTFPSPCFARRVEFVLYAEHPWFWREEEYLIATVEDDTGTTPDTRTWSATIDGPDDPSMVTTSIITIDNSMHNTHTLPIYITGAPSLWMGSSEQGCPPNRQQRPPVGIAVVVGPGEILQLDGSTRRAYNLNDNYCQISIARNVALMDGSCEYWPEVEPCESWCVGVWSQDEGKYPFVDIAQVSRADG